MKKTNGRVKKIKRPKLSRHNVKMLQDKLRKGHAHKSKKDYRRENKIRDYYGGDY